VARERVFRSAYDNLADSVMHSTSTTYYGSGEETTTAIEAVAIAVEDEYAARARRIEAQLCSGLCQLLQAFRSTRTRS
jgi:putrescine aminotransferase